MNRKVDVKALVSHIVRGDGADRCRICMGDTSEGQVYLGDTVLIDDGCPVTLAELLEIVSGVEVPLQEDLPTSLCTTCTSETTKAANFRTFIHEAFKKWHTVIDLIDSLPTIDTSNCNSIFGIVKDSGMVIWRDKIESTKTKVKPAAEKPLGQVKKRVGSKNYVCPDCGKEFLNSNLLYNHLKESPLIHACHKCAEVLPRDGILNHLMFIHNIQPYQCKICPALLRTKKQHNKHMAQAHASGACTCGECGRTFRSQPAYNAHLSVHSPKTCPGCDKLYRNQTCYLHHVKNCCDLNRSRADAVHTKTKVKIEVENERSKRKIKVGLRGSADTKCICDYCKKTFAGKRFVCAHIQIVHMKNTHRPCPYCGKLLAAAHMTEHVKTHENVKSFKCSHCPCVLKSKLGYVQHLRIHTGEKPYRCKICDEAFLSSTGRALHMRKVHKTSEIKLRHACELCPAKFQLPYHLRKHIASVHSNEDTKKIFECNICKEKFKSCRSLVHHNRSHQKEAENLKKYSTVLITQ